VMDLADLQKLAVGRAAEGPTHSAAHAAPAVQVDMQVRNVVAKAVTGVFVLAVGVAGLALLLITLIPVLPLDRHSPKPAAAPAEG